MQGLPPRSPQNSNQRSAAPPSDGKATPNQTQPKNPPSSDDGKLEGLNHASMDNNMCMQCTSNPNCVDLLHLLEEIVDSPPAPDSNFGVAANYVIRARTLLDNRELPNAIGANERFFTGAMANALNSVLNDGYCVLHQACLGAGTTHSDLSATFIDPNRLPAATLMVGEGKWNADNLRNETRGQIFNELLRHRALDRTMKRCYDMESDVATGGPILLLAFDKHFVEIDLAFPSTKGGKLEQDQIVEFATIEERKEAFWTVRMFRTSIVGTNGKRNLAIALRFISDSLKKLNAWSGQARVQCKMPMSVDLKSEILWVDYHGENVTIIEDSSGSKNVFKEYCYHLREASDVMAPLLSIEDVDKRLPPPRALLQALGSPYTEWIVDSGPFRTSVLRYPFIKGSSYKPSMSGWLKILLGVQKMHEIDFVHGDLLPRNVLFTEEGGCLIDFDLSRKVDSPYVAGYNFNDFKQFRHSEAKGGREMKKEHDLHSLRQMSCFFFELKQVDLSANGLGDLIKFFESVSDLPINADLRA